MPERKSNSGISNARVFQVQLAVSSPEAPGLRSAAAPSLLEVGRAAPVRSPPRQNPESWKRIRRTCVTLTFNGVCLAVCGQPLAPSGASAFLPRTFRSPRKSKTLFQPHCLTPRHPAESLYHHSLGGNASALGPQFSLLANGDAYPGKDGKVNHKRGAPPPPPTVLPRLGGRGLGCSLSCL